MGGGVWSGGTVAGKPGSSVTMNGTSVRSGTRAGALGSHASTLCCAMENELLCTPPYAPVGSPDSVHATVQSQLVVGSVHAPAKAVKVKAVEPDAND